MHDPDAPTGDELAPRPQPWARRVVHRCCLACGVRLSATAPAAAPCPCCGDPTVAVGPKEALGSQLWGSSSESLDALVQAVAAALPPRGGDVRG